MSEEEQAIVATLEVGAVDEEIRLTRIRLMRALARENELADTLEMESEKVEPLQVEGEDTGLSKVTTTKKVRDYSTLIDRLTARIESLEKTRAELLKASSRELDDEIKRLEVEKRRAELSDGDGDTPTPVKVIVEVKDARKPDAEP